MDNDQTKIQQLEQKVAKLEDLFYRMYQNDKFFLDKVLMLQYGTLYVVANGDLYWKTKGGVATKVN